MIPIRDEIPSRTKPIVTVGLITLNVLVFFWQASLGPEQEYGILQWGLIPIEFRGMFTYAHGAFTLRPLVTLFTSMFLHGTLGHLAGNMLFLWIFGNNVEDALGHARFLVFYLAAGVVGALTQVFTASDPTVSMIGASGAISGVLGGYLILYPFARVVAIVPFTIVRVPAFFFLLLWFLLQLLSGAATYGAKGGGVAFLAHAGGFVAGVVLVRPLARRRASPLRRALRIP